MFRVSSSLIAIAVILSLFSGGACTYPQAEKSAGYKDESAMTAEEATSRLKAAGSPELAQNGKTLNQALDEMVKSYKIQPDRRFILAVPRIATFFGEPRRDATVAFVKGRWRVSWGDLVVGELSDFSDYSSSMKMLTDWASKCKARSQNFSLATSTVAADELRKGLTQFTPNSLISVLDQAERLWKNSHSMSVLETAATAVVYLQCQNLDVLGVADELSAEALSLLAITSAVSDSKMLEENCLLADRLGYFTASRELGLRLPRNNAVREFALRNQSFLKAAAEDPHTTPLKQYLYLCVLGYNGESDLWKQYVKGGVFPDSSANLPLLTTFGFSLKANAQATLPVAAYLLIESVENLRAKAPSNRPFRLQNLEWSLDTATETTPWLLRGLISEFENLLSEKVTQSYEPFISQDGIKSFHRGYFDSGIAVLCDAYFNSPASHQLCRSFLEAQGEPSNQEARELKSWLLARMQFKEKQTSVRELISLVKAFPTLGNMSREFFFVDLRWYEETDDRASLFPACKTLFSLVDSRPNGLTTLGFVARNLAMDQRLANEIVNAKTRLGDIEALNVNLEYLKAGRSFAKLRALLKNPLLTSQQRVAIVSWAATDSIGTKEEIAQEYLTLCRLYPRDWYVAEYAAGNFAKNKRTMESAQVLHQWLSENKHGPQDDREKATARLAELYHILGKPQEGLKTLRMISRSEQFGYFRISALLSQSAGKTEDAEAWMEEALRRFPGYDRCIALAAEIYWRNGKYAKAAEMLSRYQEKLASRDWGTNIAPAFYDVFGSNQNKAYLALSELADHGIAAGNNLGIMARYTNGEGMPEFAYLILSFVRDFGNQRAEITLEKYRYLKAWKGTKEALKWINHEVPRDERCSMCDLIFGAVGLSELLWEFIPEKPSDEYAPRIWLLRAADSLVSNYPLTQNQRDSIKSYFYRPAQTVGDLLGKHMLGLPGGERLFDVKMNSEQISKSAFFVGLQALSRGNNINTDTAWFRLCIDQGNEEIREYTWARGFLIIIETHSLLSSWRMAQQQVKKMRLKIDCLNGHSRAFVLLATSTVCK